MPGPLMGETTDCLYRSHKFPKDNIIVTLSTYTILHPRDDFSELHLFEKFILILIYLCKTNVYTKFGSRDGQ